MRVSNCILIFCLALSPFYSSACDEISFMPLIKGSSAFYAYEGIDTDSDEKVIRHYYTFSDGDQLIFENKYCLMNNYVVNYQSEKLNLDKLKLRVGLILDGIKDKHQLTVSPDFFSIWFYDSEKLELVVDSKFSSIEVSGTREYSKNSVLHEMISLYVGVGGEP